MKKVLDFLLNYTWTESKKKKKWQVNYILWKDMKSKIIPWREMTNKLQWKKFLIAF
jgi:hypothetical protein